MPKALAHVDWDFARTLYLQGLTYQEIAAKVACPFETVRQRARRGAWPDSRDKAKTVSVDCKVAKQTGESPAESKSQARSEQVRAGLAAVLVRSVEKLASMPIPTHKVALRVNGELESVVRNAKTVFGWSDATTAPAIRIGVLAQVTIQPALAPEPSQSQPVIDVETTQGVTSGDTTGQS